MTERRDRMNIEGRIETIDIPDGTKLGVTVYRQPNGNPAPVVICNPAMGVPASYYKPMVTELYSAGNNVITSDLRGIGLSSVRVNRRRNFGYSEMISLDFASVVEEAHSLFPGSPVFLMGHSLGGQLSCLFASLKPQAVSGIILVAACSVYYASWSHPRRWGVLLFEQVVSFIARTWGYYPGKFFRFGGCEAQRMIGDWAHQGRTGRYEPAGNGVDFESLLAEIELPVLALSFDDDGLCPRQAVGHLLAKMPKARATSKHLSPADLGTDSIGHFGWVKKADLVAPAIIDWLHGINEPREENKCG
jgi:predicted alpha/beta hydrolase